MNTSYVLDPTGLIFLDPLTFSLPQHSIIERDVVHRL